MHKLLHKVAPLGVMTACVIWCCWSQLRESTPLLAATEANLPRIERKLLSPEMSPASERDPFLQYKPAPTPASVEIAAEVKVEEKPPFDPRTVLPSIRLDATILGARPLAVINGTIHNQGESIVLEASPEVKCQLQRVLADGIVMKIEQQTFVIGYSNTPKEVTEPASATDAAPQDTAGFQSELPKGIPTLDELEGAIANSLANQPPPADSQDSLNSKATDKPPTNATHEDCKSERDLLIDNKIDELLNNYE